MRGRRRGGFLTFSSKAKRNLPVFSVWKELPGGTGVPPKRGAGRTHRRDGRATCSERALKTVNTMKCGIKQKRRGMVLACLLASDFLRTVHHCVC